MTILKPYSLDRPFGTCLHWKAFGPASLGGNQRIMHDIMTTNRTRFFQIEVDTWVHATHYLLVESRLCMHVHEECK